MQLISANIQPFGLVVYHDSKQLRPLDYKNPCNRANCSHMCLLSMNSTYECKCPYFMKLDDDKKTCKEIDTMIFISNEYDIRSFDYNDLMTSNKRSLNIMPPLTRNDIDNINSIEFDPIDKLIYFMDGAHGYIARIHLNGSGYEKIINSGIYFEIKYLAFMI